MIDGVAHSSLGAGGCRPPRAPRKTRAGEKRPAGYLSRQEERRLVRKAQAGDVSARNALVERHIGFIRDRAGKAGRGDVDEVLGAAVEGFCAAIAAFDLDRHTSLLTYADLAVRRHVRRQLLEDAVVKVPAWSAWGRASAGVRKAAESARQVRPLEERHVARRDCPLAALAEREERQELLGRALGLAESLEDWGVLHARLMGLSNQQAGAEQGYSRVWASEKVCRAVGLLRDDLAESTDG